MIVGGGSNYTMPSGVATSTRSEKWRAREKDLKQYLHFDRRRSQRHLEKLANDPQRVARHPFFPLIQFEEEWVKFRGDGEGKKKVRKLRYAARADAAIFARYRVILSELYEKELQILDVGDVPIAYRKIPSQLGLGKNNIDFAHEIFSFVRETGDCYVTVLDISSYFESLDHDRITLMWGRLMRGSLPPDHAAVLKALTQFSTVKLSALQKRMELFERINSGNRYQRRMRKIDLIKAQRHLQLMSPREFRQKVCGGDPSLPSLLQRHRLNYGIPQGTPISDIVANFYLLDFDVELKKWASMRGGICRRYSDDIIIVVPTGNQMSFDDARIFAQSEIVKYGNKLTIQDRKVAVGEFRLTNGGIQYSHLFGEACKNGLEYLGFEFDGKVVKIKSSTLSNAWRRLKRRSFGYAKRYVKRYRLKGDAWVEQNYPSEWLGSSVIRKVTVGQNKGYRSWTFIKYVRQASKKFRDFDRIFSRQTARYRKAALNIVRMDLKRAVEIYGYQARVDKGQRP